MACDTNLEEKMGKAIYFTDEELGELEQALIGHSDGAMDKFMPVIESAALKVGLGLERPWALEKQSEINLGKVEEAHGEAPNA